MNYTYSDIQALSIYKKLINNGWIDVCTKRQKENNLIALHHENFTEQTNVKAAIFIKYPYVRLSNDGIHPTTTTSTRPVAKNFLNKTVYTYKNGLPDFSHLPRIENSGIENDIDFMETALNYVNDSYSTIFKQIVSKKFEITHNKSVQKIKNNKSFYVNEYVYRNAVTKDSTCKILQGIKAHNMDANYEILLSNIKIEHRTLVAKPSEMNIKRLIIRSDLYKDLQEIAANVQSQVLADDVTDSPTSLWSIRNLYDYIDRAKLLNPNIEIDVKVLNSTRSYIDHMNEFKEHIKKIAIDACTSNPIMYNKFVKPIVDKYKIELTKDVKFITDMAKLGIFDED